MRTSWMGWMALVIVVSITARPAGAASKTPNIVVILADDVGWSDLGCYGADLHETPNLDRLAGQGVRFTQAYSASVCSPTRSSLLTGKHWVRLGITIWMEAALKPPQDKRLIPPTARDHLPLEEITLAERLKETGYLTFHVGKWHLGPGAFYPETQGFDVNIGGTFWGAPATHFFPYRGTTRSGELRYVPGLGMGKEGDELTDRMTDHVLNLIDQAGDRPFFLNLWYHNAHTPIEAKKDLVRHYEAKRKSDLKHQNAEYAAMIHTLDENVGRVLKKLDEEGIAENTIVVFLSDNGGYVTEYEGVQVTNNAPLRSGKGSLYEGGIRVPWIMRGPGIAGGATCRDPVVVMDLMPTILGIVGSKSDEPKKRADGRDLQPLLVIPEGSLPPRPLCFHYPHYYFTTTPVSAIRMEDWKLLHYYEDDRTELYDLETDVGETKDLAVEQPAKVRELQELLGAWKKEVGASDPRVNPDGKGENRRR